MKTDHNILIRNFLSNQLHGKEDKKMLYLHYFYFWKNSIILLHLRFLFSLLTFEPCHSVEGLLWGCKLQGQPEPLHCGPLASTVSRWTCCAGDAGLPLEGCSHFHCVLYQSWCPFPSTRITGTWHQACRLCSVFLKKAWEHLL